jgi:uncharacterized membrane protein
MAPRIMTKSGDRKEAFLRWASAGFALLGALDAIYLWIYKISNNDRMCLGSGDCATVNYSSYSEIYGIPVAVLGIGAYLLILVIHILETRWRPVEKNGNLLIFGLSLAGVLFSAYLTYIEYFVIFAVCPFCLASAFFILFIFVIAIIRLVKNLA